LELEDRSQALYQAEMAAMQHLGSMQGRFRTFGGSSSPTQLAGSASFIRALDYSPTPTLQPSMGRRTHHLGPRVLDYKGRSFDFRADQLAVAPGAIESSRLLLASVAVPNEYDQLGCIFHDHLSLHAAVLPRTARRRIFGRLGPFVVNGVPQTLRDGSHLRAAA
jgi:hypothetical protein